MRVLIPSLSSQSFRNSIPHSPFHTVKVMTDLSLFDPNTVSNPKNNIFGLPFDEEDAKLIILPVPWEVTVSCTAGTARAPEHIFKASLQVDLFDPEFRDAWKQGYFMRAVDRKVLMKSDYLRKEAELYINYISEGENVNDNKFMCKTLKEVNAGSIFMNEWVFQQTKELLDSGKLVGLLGGDHSTPFGFLKAIAEKHGDFGILQIDAHCDLRKAYENFNYSHASVMYNSLEQIPQLKKLVQIGIRDYCEEEWDYIVKNNQRVITYFDKDIKERLYEGQTWQTIVSEMIEHLPQKVYISFDIDGLDPKLCPHTDTPVQGGFETEQIFYLLKKLLNSGRQIIGFDLNEVGISNNEWDENVGARCLFKLCNTLIASSQLHDSN